jgi:GrpB-like predicted nucleotidyltransferase (UPF0157 family)
MIAIVPYNSEWVESFAAEAERIRMSFGSEAERIEHVGSTSVPGLAAKSVIDIQISVPSLARRDLHHQHLKALGYTHFPLGDFDLVYPFFKRPEAWPSTHHVHLCESHSHQERVHVAFRDYLRRHPTIAAEYASLKLQLATAHHGLTMQSQEAYSLAKTEFITRVLQLATQEESLSKHSDDA